MTTAAGLAALSAAEDLQRAQARLVPLRQGHASTDGIITALRQADQDVDAAARSLDGWAVDLLAAVPVLGRSWVAERAVTRTAREVLAGAVVLADSLPAVSASSGGVDLTALARLRRDVHGPEHRSRDALDRLQRVPVGLTPPQVARGVADAEAALRPAVDALQATGQGLDVVSGLLGGDGPRSVLVMLQNNAELRGAGGYASSFATGRTDAGRLTLARLEDVVDVADPPERARRVPAPEEYLEDYGHLSANTTMWQSWNMSPHVPDAAQVGARIAGQLLGQEPDVVLLLDVPALSALAALGGDEVVLPGGDAVSPEELTDALLVDSYAAAGTEVEAQIRRRLQLQAAASTAVGRLLSGDVSAPDLARTLVRLAEGRHLAVWSARAHEQVQLEALGVAGQVVPPRGGDLAHVSVNNIGSNKLDVYVDRAVSVAAAVGPTSVEVTQRVRFTNAAPADLVPYVAGVERPGVVVSRVELSLPPSADGFVATVDGRPWQGALHRGGGRTRLITRLELPRGASAVLEVRYALAITDGRYRLRLVPQPLVRDAALDLTIRGVDGEGLAVESGAAGRGGQVGERGTLTVTRDIVVQLPRPSRSRVERLLHWWNSPLELG